ncbi:flagellar hook-length control protein FliK [Paenibacillus sepulcri]|uniref:Flagellar hook-length control protein FliK n=1 Tax=Paenibacillus sepulcri TaxID=359917 RepID=A0ABS7BYI5_9BACL|nr:flagellar hook-length control protein FliK [Paenibacillus sepulcri]
MQMPISQAAPGASSAQAGTASAKQSGSDAFVQTLVQTITGSNAGTSQAAEGGVSTGKMMDAAQLTALLGENVSAADLIAAITELLKKLDSLDEEDGDTSVSKEDLTDALKQVEDLLAMLGAVPLIPQPVTDPAAESGGTENEQLPTTDLPIQVDVVTGSATAAVVQPTLNVLSAAAVQPSIQPPVVPEVDNSEAVAVLKAGLQDALVDLRSLLQQGKNGKTNRDLLAAVGQQLTEVEQKLDGKKQTAALPQAFTGISEEVLDSLRPILTAAPAPNVHLQRMAHQLFHVGVLTNHASSEEKVLAAEDPGAAIAEGFGTETPVVTANQELQRQIQMAKPLLVQPVPVQQFAENMQNLIVKQFHVSSADGVSEARISLFPEHLGQVDVRITVQNGLLTAMFMTDTSAAKDMLENQMAQLRASLLTQGLQVDKLEVSQNTVQTSLFQDRQGQSGRDQQSGKRGKGKDDALGGISSFDTDLEELAVDQAVDRHMGLGRGIHARA